SRLVLLLPQLGVVHGLQGLFERQGIIAAVIGEAGCGGVGERVLVDEVLETDFGGVHFQLGRENVDHAFHSVGRFGAAGAAIGIGGDGVREHSDNVGLDVLTF